MEAENKAWGEVERLVRLAQAGDRNAFGELFERFRGRVLALARQRHRDPLEAEELLQEVFLHALRKLSQLREPACFGAWLRRITVRVSINRAVRRSPIPSTDPDILAAVTADDTASPHDDAVQAEQRRNIHSAVARLRPLDRQALVAFYLKGKPLAQIAGELDVPLGTVKRRLHTARKRLKESLARGRRTRRAELVPA